MEVSDSEFIVVNHTCQIHINLKDLFTILSSSLSGPETCDNYSGHLYNTDTSLLRTVRLVPERLKSI